MKSNKDRLVFNRTNGHCGYCGVPLNPLENWHVDHIVPLSRNGEDTLDNKVAACSPCNRRKHAFSVEQFRNNIRDKALKLLEGFYTDWPYYDIETRKKLDVQIEAIQKMITEAVIAFPVESIQSEGSNVKVGKPLTY